MDAIKITNLTKTYWSRRGERAVVSDLTLSVSRGLAFGFLGPNGAGKTTTIKMLVGLTEADGGTVEILGASPASFDNKKKIGFMPESAAFYSYLTGEEFLYFIADIFGLEERQKKERTEMLLKRVDLTDAKDIQIRKYSKGMGQRLGLAQSLMNDPEVIFLDEPFDGLDPLGRAEAKQLLLGMKREGKTIFFNSHILSDVAEICDEVGIIDRGVLIEKGAVSDILKGHDTLERAFVDIIRATRNNRA